MAVTLQNLLDDLNDRLNDTANAQASVATKTRFINYGIAATWPDLYRVVTASASIVAGTSEYPLTALAGLDARIARIEVQTTVGGAYVDAWDTSVNPTATSPLLIFRGGAPGATGCLVRATAAAKLTKLSLVTDNYDGPLGTDELPVLYAMAMCTSRPVDDRLDYKRYSTTADKNGVGVEELTGVASFWMDQYDRLLERNRMPPLGAIV